VTRDELAKVSHTELVERMLAAHAQLEQVAQQVERERERREQAERQLRWFKNQLFGAKSERRIGGEDTGGQQLFLGEIEVDPEETVRGTAVRSHERRRRQPKDVPDEKGLRFDDSVPVETVVLPNPELEGVPEDELELVGERVRHLLCQKPAAYVIKRIVRQTFKRKDTGALTTAPAIAAVLEKSYADVSLLAGMLVDKFRYHLPLYRQHQRLQASGITVSRTSLTSWVAQAAWLLEPVYEAQCASVLASQVLAMDETPLRAGRSKAKGKMKTGFYWPIYGDRDEVIFPFAPSRAHRVAEAFLGGFEGTLLSDGYPAYEAFAEKRSKVVHARCWAHTRRYFVRAEDVEPRRAARALDSIRTLYAHEEVIRERGLDRREALAFRGEHSKPVVDALFSWLREELQGAALLPSNPFTVAAHYALEAQRELEVFLADPDVPIDTNHLERALRVIPMGKKNWLFCWSELGAHQVGHVQSLLTTCVLHGVDPYTYLVDVLQRVDLQPQSRVHELTPRLWKDCFGHAPLGSWAD
jgi:transposase